MDSITDDSFEKRVEAFPMHVQPTFDRLRALVHEVAQKSEISQIEMGRAEFCGSTWQYTAYGLERKIA